MQRLKEVLQIGGRPRRTKVLVTGQALNRKPRIPSMFKSIFLMGSESQKVPRQDFYQQSRLEVEEAKRASQQRSYSFVCRGCSRCWDLKLPVRSLSTSALQLGASPLDSLCGPSSHRAAAVEGRTQTLIATSVTSSPPVKHDTDGKKLKKALYSCLNQLDGNVGKWKDTVENEVRIMTCSQESLVAIGLNTTPEFSAITQVPNNSPGNSPAQPQTLESPTKKTALGPVANGSHAEDVSYAYLSSRYQRNRSLPNTIQDALQSNIDSPSNTQSATLPLNSQNLDFPVAIQPFQKINLENFVPDAEISVLELPPPTIPQNQLSLWSAPRSLFYPSFESAWSSLGSPNSNSVPASLLREPELPGSSTNSHVSIPSSLIDSDYLWELGKARDPSLAAFPNTDNYPPMDLSYFSRDREMLHSLSFPLVPPPSPESSGNSDLALETATDSNKMLQQAERQQQKDKACRTCHPGKENWCNTSHSIFGSTPPAYTKSGGVHLRGGGNESFMFFGKPCTGHAERKESLRFGSRDSEFILRGKTG